MKRLRDLNHGGFRDACSEEREKVEGAERVERAERAECGERAECVERVECAEWAELELGSRMPHARIERRTAL